EGSLSNEFSKKIKFDNIDESKIKTISNPNYTNILINAIENSDAIIKGSEELPAELEEFLKTTDKPVLDYFHVSEFDTAYTEFYLSKVL
ncbi:MAG: glycogen synthase, partial [Flavobacteriaceae bacterium]